MTLGESSRNRRKRLWRSVVLGACLAGQLTGCRTPKQIHYFGDADLQYYKQQATQVDFPHVHTESDPGVNFSDAPPTVRDPSQQEIWDLGLADAIQLAVTNNKIIKARAAFKSPANPLMSNPERVVSTLDPAIQESSANPLNPGVEEALSAFDAQFKTSMKWGRDENVQNNFFLGGGLGNGQTLTNENAQFRSSVEKMFANGGTFAVSHDWNYTATNQRFNLFPSVYRGYVRTDYRQPLLAGSGVDYTRVAGRSIPGFNFTGGGVVIARINSDISIADFELNVTNMVRDVEDLYWELYLAYRTYDAELSARAAALQFWRTTKRRMEVGARKGAVVDEVQARENYFSSRMRVENALGTLYASEGALRRMVGLPVNDGRIIRPADEPLTAEYTADWHMALSESLVRRVELRRQKWQIKSLELQLTAAENLIRPRLDFVAGYQVNGFGDNLLSYDAADGQTTEGLNSAYTTLTRGDQTSWDLGFEMSLPIGLRSALANKRNMELRLAKSRALLNAQELEISHELSNSFQLVDWWYQLAETNFHRRNAAAKETEVIEQEYDAGRVPVDLLLRSRAELAAAETGYHSALVKYNQALTDLRVRKGSLLEENGVYLAEGGWEPQAYDEALRRAWARSYAYDAKHLATVPPEFVEGGQPAWAVPYAPTDISDVPTVPEAETQLPISQGPLPAPEGPSRLNPVPSDSPPAPLPGN
ncbi:TolC family protein [bacterium]|nr:TolC family protein [bacterium]